MSESLLPVFAPKGDGIPDLVDVLMTVKVIEDETEKVKRRVRDDLYAKIIETEKTIGSAFTSRTDSGTASVTAPVAKARISAPVEFAADVDARVEGLTEKISKVVVTDTKAAAAALLMAEHGVEGGLAKAMLAAFRRSEQVLTKDGALDSLIEDGKIAVTDSAAFWTEDGEAVAGVTVSKAGRTLQTRFTTDAKKKRLAELARAGQGELA